MIAKSKKYLLTLAAVLCCAMTMTLQTSCSKDNDDNVLPIVENVITINTATLYDELGITELMTERLAKGEFTLTDSVLIYDQVGKLVAKLGAESNSLAPLTIQVQDLPDGSYTLVAWQSAYNDKGVRVWKTFDETDLSTVGITTKNGSIEYGWAVGYASTTASIEGGNIGVTITPKPMVGIVDVEIDNYPEDAPFTQLVVFCWSENTTSGFYLDPSRSEDERWQRNFDENWEGLAIINPEKSGNKYVSLCSDAGKWIILFVDYPDGTRLSWEQSEYFEMQAGDRALCYFDFERRWKAVYFGSPEGFSTWFDTPFLDQIKQIENISKSTEFYPLYAYGYKEYISVEFEQPIDHKNPEAGTFKQRSLICYRGSDRPTILYTCGYQLGDNILYPDNGLAQYMDANLIFVEYRYFGESTVTSDPRWDYLTFEQAACDHHNIVQTLKPLLPKEWISTGNSKCGETALLFRYYFPDDVTLTVPFCAPFMTSLHDTSSGRYLMDECGTPEERTQMKALIRRMLQGGEQGIYTKFAKQMQQIRPNDDRSFTQYVFYCFEFAQGYFQYGIPAQRQMPSLDSTDEELLDQMLGDFLAGDYAENDPDFYPYFIQSVKQIGAYAHAYGDFSDLLAGTSFNEEQAHRYLTPLKEEDQWLYDTYDNTVYKDIRERFVPTTTCPILFVYAKDDPFTGAGIKDINEQYSKIIINPDGSHSDFINRSDEYSEKTVQDILEFVGRYIDY